MIHRNMILSRAFKGAMLSLNTILIHNITEASRHHMYLYQLQMGLNLIFIKGVVDCDFTFLTLVSV